MPFCPKCGKDIAPGQVFCEEHQEHKLEAKPFDIVVCDCGRFFAKNRWFVPNDIQESVVKVIKDHVKQHVEVKEVSFELPEKRGKKAQGEASISFMGESFPLAFATKNQRCDKCAKLGTHYFTAKLQLREPPEGVLAFIEEFMAGKEEKGVSINKVEDTPRGPDLYLTHKSAARQLGEKLVRKFGGVMKQSEQLFSRNHQTSKNLYRLNVVVEFSKFRQGDVIMLGNRVVLVTGMGKQCTGRDLALDKKVVFLAGDEERVLQKQKTTVAMTHPEVAVIHPVSFQQVPVANAFSFAQLRDGDQVMVVIAGKKVFLVP